jgi:hypothetical protein
VAEQGFFFFLLALKRVDEKGCWTNDCCELFFISTSFSSEL